MLWPKRKVYVLCAACFIALIGSIVAWRVHTHYLHRLLHRPGVFVVMLDREPRSFWLRLVVGDESLSDVLTITLTDTDLSATELQTIKNLRNLEKISIENCSNANDLLASLGQLPKLQLVDIAAESGTLDLNRLAGLATIQSVSIKAERSVDLSLEFLGTLPNVQDVMLEGDAFTDQEVRELIGCKSLRELTVRRSPVTDGCLPYLKHMSELSVLEISNAQIKGGGLPHILGLSSLRHLDLSSNPIDDASIEFLLRFDDLKTLQLESTMISQSGIRKLTEALPNCKIQPSEVVGGMSNDMTE